MVKPGGARTAAPTGKGALKSAALTAAASAPKTVGMEPGARILGAKDGNHNRQQQNRGSQTAVKEKGKGKAEPADCGVLIGGLWTMKQVVIRD